MFSGQVELTIFLSQAGNLGIYDWIMYAVTFRSTGLTHLVTNISNCFGTREI
jgi:hypothetical protein